MIDDNLHIPIQKDIGEYEQKLFGDMSIRTCVSLAGGFATAVAVAAIGRFWLGIDPSDASLPVMAATLPFWLAGFWKPHGMPFERFAPLVARHHLSRRTYLFHPSHAELLPTPPAHEPRKLKRRERKKIYRKGAELYEPAE